MILHGGKSRRGEQLVREIRSLPPGVKRRLVLENDEYAFGADEILEICRRAKVPMVFDAHHHLIKEKLDSYEHPGIARFTRLARTTWSRPQWQIVHLSNGLDGLRDRQHSEFIRHIPTAYRRAPWIEVEARAKDLAIERLRLQWPGVC